MSCLCVGRGLPGLALAGEEPELCLRAACGGCAVPGVDGDMTRTSGHDTLGPVVAAGSAGVTRSRSVLAAPRRARCGSGPGGAQQLVLGPVLPLRRSCLPSGRADSVSCCCWATRSWGCGSTAGVARRGNGRAAAGWYAVFCVLGKFANVVGQFRFHRRRLLAQPSLLIEYKRTLPGNPRARYDMRVAYLVNQYPHVSHSFIRREIAGLEAQGLVVDRSPSGRTEDLVDPADQAEQRRTAILLEGGVAGLLASLLVTACSRPLAGCKPWPPALRLGRRSERGVPRHLAYLAEACVLLHQLRQTGTTPARPLRHQLHHGRPAGFPPRRAALQLHRPRAGGI